MMRKQYRVLIADDARNEALINKFAKEGFVITHVATVGAPYTIHITVYMERDAPAKTDPRTDVQS